MSEVDDAIRIFQTQGPVALVRRFAGYLRYVVGSRAWHSYYRAKAGVTGSSIVTVGGVRIDTAIGLSPAMVEKLRTRRYETDETRLIRWHLRADLPVIDLGAGIGYTAVIASRSIDPSQPVIAVEANPSLVPIMRRTLDLNDSSFRIVSAAYRSKPGPVIVYASEDVLSSTTNPSGDRVGDLEPKTVEAVTLREVVDEHRIDDCFQLLVDIEGGECDLVSNELSLLQQRCYQLLVEFHPAMDYEVDEYVTRLTESGFKRVETAGDVCLFRNQALAS